MSHRFEVVDEGGGYRRTLATFGTRAEAETAMASTVFVRHYCFCTGSDVAWQRKGLRVVEWAVPLENPKPCDDLESLRELLASVAEVEAIFA